MNLQNSTKQLITNKVEENCGNICNFHVDAGNTAHSLIYKIFFNTLLSVTFPFSTVIITLVECTTHVWYVLQETAYSKRNTSCRPRPCVTFTSAAKHDLVIIKLSTDRKDFPTRSLPGVSNFLLQIKNMWRNAKKKVGLLVTLVRTHSTTHGETVCDDCWEFSFS